MDRLRPDDPAQLGPFTLRARLGAGGMGVVYLARGADGLEVAVKTVPRGVGADVRTRLRREAQLLATVDHPRIARFVAADADADEPWLAMRYVPGPSLADERLPLPKPQLRQLADGLAEALAALHRLGVTHRDVKPGNIIMTSVGAVLVDLGIAVTADASSMTMAGTAVGSPAWMAPEQFTGNVTGPPTDVWGWAAVLTYAATGREPFGVGAIGALANRIMSQPADLRGVPEWLLGAVELSFAKRPEERPKAFDLIRGGRARVANPAARPYRPGPTGSRTAGAPPRAVRPGERPAGPPWAGVPGLAAGPAGRVGHPSGPVGRPSGPVGHPSGPVGHPSGPVGHPSGPVGHPSGPVPQPAGGRRPPARPTPRVSPAVVVLVVVIVLAVVAIVLAATLRG